MKALLPSPVVLRSSFFVLIFIAMQVISINGYGQAPPLSGTQTKTPGRIFDKIFDRFGNAIPIEKYRIPGGSNSISSQSLIGATCSSGYFDLDFEVGCGMEGSSPNEIAMRAVICKVFEHLSQFINPVNSNNHVHILVQNPNIIGAGNWLAVASPFYCVPIGATYQTGIIDNVIWQTINSGVNAWTNIGSPILPAFSGSNAYYHGMLVININNYPASSWHTNLSTNPPANLLDMYSVVLHESMHLLGFESLIGETGNSLLNNVSGNFYNRFDMHLYSSTNIPLISNTGTCNMYNYQFNSTLVSDLHPSSNCISDYTNCSTAINYVGLTTTPVYTPNCWEAGSSLSHFEDLCVSGYINNESFVMSNGSPPGISKRHLLPEERSVLCDIGYSVNNTFGSTSTLNAFTYSSSSCPGIGVVGINDGIGSGGVLTYSVAWGTSNSIDIPISDVMSNDYFAINAGASIECVEEVYGMGAASIVGSNIHFIPYNVSGITVIRYIPKLANGQRGNITYVYINISDPTCGIVTSCNMVSNSGVESNGGSCGSLGYFGANTSCWSSACGSADLLHYGCGSITNLNLPCYSSIPQTDTYSGQPTDNAMIGLYAENNYSGVGIQEEWVRNRLSIPVTSGNTYTLKCKVKVANNFSSNPNLSNAYLGLFLCNYNITYVWDIDYSLFNIVTGPGTSIYDFFMIDPGVPIPNDNAWHEITKTFTFTFPYDMYWLYLGHTGDYYTASSGDQYLYLDDVELTPAAVAVNFLGMPNCGDLNTVLPNLFQYVNVNSGVFTTNGPGITGTGTNTTFNASLAGPGINEITFTYTNPNTGCPTILVSTIYIQDILHNTISICPPFPISFTGATNYTWSPLTNLSILTANGSSVIATPSTSTVYTVVATGLAGQCPSTYTFQLEPMPVLSLTTSSICNPATLSATPGFTTYTWTDPNLNNTIGSNTFLATLGGMYTVTASNSAGCTSSTSLNIMGFTASITSTTGFHCTPNELHAWPQGTGYDYHWYPPIGTPLTLPVNLPDFGMTYTQGTYTVIVTDGNGCASSATFSLSNGPDLTSLSAIMNGTICASSATLSVGLNSGLFPVYTFLWTPISPAPGFSTSNTFKAVTTNTLNSISTYSVMVTDGVGCTSTGSITVQPLSGSPNFCSCQGGIDLVGDNTVIKVDNTNSNDLANNPIYGGGTPLGTNISGKKFYIDGNFIINLSMIFDNCTIYVSPNSRITVNSGTVLQLINNTKLQSPTPDCPMWDGIYASGANSEVIINGQSTIRDMENGVNISAAAKLNTDNAKYYDNRISIQLNNLPAAYSGEITNCTFESVTGLISPWTSLIRPLNGIIIANCKKATVGTPGNGNFFKSLHNGVYISSNFINSFVPNTYFISLFYNRFEDIIGGINLWTPLSLNGNTIYNTSKGCAILGINKNPKSKVNISIWGDALPDGNIMNFKNCNKAIILNGFDAQVHNNRTIGTKAGILFNQVEGKQMWVEGNELNDVLLGISKIGNEAATTWGYYCEKNKITLAWGGSPLSGTNYLPMGINSNYFSSVNNGYTLMKDNIIKIPNGDYSVGLHLQNGFNDYIYNNDIEFNYTGSDPAPHPTPDLLGIDLSNNVNAFVFTNTIHGQNIPMFLAQRRIAAIQMHHNDQSFLDCNVIDNVQFGFYVVGNNNTQGYDRVRNNHINTQNAGMLFRHLSNEGTLGDIGKNLLNNIYDANNKFSGNNNLSKVYRFSSCTSILTDRIVTQNIPQNVFQSESNSSGGLSCRYQVTNLGSATFTTPPYLCSPPNITLTTTIGDEDNAEYIAEDSTEYVEYEDGGRWLDNQMLMRWLSRDTITKQNNPILNAYYLSHHQEALGYLYDVDNMLAALSDSTLLEDSTAWRGVLQETKDMNNAISCSTLFETNEKTMNTLYIKYMELGLDALSETEISFIQDLADNCPYIDGNAVFKARHMYSMFVPNFYYNDLDICNQIGVYKGGTSMYEQENNLLGDMAKSILLMDELKVYPNPTDGQINIAYHINHTETALFTIYNMYGSMVRTLTLDGEKNIITTSLNNLPRGFYTYKCTVTGRILSTGKLILK